MLRLGEQVGRSFGDPADPLLVSVRSGAPGIDAGHDGHVLNLGLNEAAAAGLARSSTAMTTLHETACGACARATAT